MRAQQQHTLRHRLGHPPKTPWNVRSMERYRHGAGVVTYLARDLRGGPIKNAWWVGYEGDRVPCTYRTRAEEPRSGSPLRPRLTLSTADFLQRWLLHVPAPQARVVRC
jgi:Putative transposase